MCFKKIVKIFFFKMAEKIEKSSDDFQGKCSFIQMKAKFLAKMNNVSCVS